MGCTDSGVPERTCRDNFNKCAEEFVEKGGDSTNKPIRPDIPELDLDTGGSDNEFTSCVSRYYGCARSARSCKETFNECTEEVPEIDIDIETDIDLPNLEKPIDDIDLGDGTGVHRPEDKPVVTSEQDNNNNSEQTLEFNPEEDIEKPEVSAVEVEVETEDVEEPIHDVTPVLKPGSGKIPEIQCMWSFFRCKGSKAACQKDHEDCVSGNKFDNQICVNVAQSPHNYLVPDPNDCTKFYSCQREGWGGWKANPMDCPHTTGFDTNLRICNYINKLPRCKSGRVLTSEDGNRLVAKQTQQKLHVDVSRGQHVARQTQNQLHVANLGYLSEISSSGTVIVAGVYSVLAAYLFHVLI
jgi:hypothetical protein